jgi:hypothetical protein
MRPSPDSCDSISSREEGAIKNCLTLLMYVSPLSATETAKLGSGPVVVPLGKTPATPFTRTIASERANLINVSQLIYMWNLKQLLSSGFKQI